MKRHKHSLLKHSRCWVKKTELKHITLNYIKKFSEFEELSITSKLLVESFFFLPVSKTTKFCMVTGRVRYTIKEALMSRHMFCSRNSDGVLVGFYMSS